MNLDSLDEDYLDSNEEESKEDNLEKPHIKFEPLTHKSEKDEGFDEEEVDIEQEVSQF